MNTPDGSSGGSGFDSEIRIQPVVWSGFIVILLLVGAAIAGKFVLAELRERSAAGQRSPSPIEEARRPLKIPGPRLLPDPESHLREFLFEETAAEKGVAAAMEEILAASSVAAEPGPPETEAPETVTPETVPTEAGGGEVSP